MKSFVFSTMVSSFSHSLNTSLVMMKEHPSFHFMATLAKTKKKKVEEKLQISKLKPSSKK